jgi:hypothetical protein
MDLYEKQIDNALRSNPSYQARLAALVARQRKLNKQTAKPKVLRHEWKKDASR